jgi:hypothetical protein
MQYSKFKHCDGSKFVSKPATNVAVNIFFVNFLTDKQYKSYENEY